MTNPYIKRSWVIVITHLFHTIYTPIFRRESRNVKKLLEIIVEIKREKRRERLVFYLFLIVASKVRLLSLGVVFPNGVR